MSAPPVTLGIASHNRFDLLQRCIGSAVEQTLAARIHLVDNASSAALPALHAGSLRMEIELSPVNLGIVGARNHMMRTAASRGSVYFCSLDDDAWFMENDALAEAVGYLEAHPKVAALGFSMCSPDRPAKSARAEARPVDTFIGCGHVLRLAAVMELGGYSTFPGFYGGEEKELCLRLIDRSWEVVCLPGVHVWHEKTPLARDQPRQHRSGVCNDLVLTLRRFPLPETVWMLPGKMLSHLRYSARHGLLAPGFGGLADFLRAMPSVLRHRDPVSRRALREYRRPERLARA